MDGFKGIHHGYLGLVMMLIGFFLIFTSLPIVVPAILIFIGFYIFIDDCWQHYKQKKKPLYQSPLHRLYIWSLKKLLLSKHFAWLARIILWLNEFYDNLLGRKTI